VPSMNIPTTSIYSKMRAVLANLKRKKFTDIYELSEYVASQKLDAFEVPTSGGGQPKFCSPAAVRKTIRFAMRLKLVGEMKEEGEAGCFLTSDGVTAARNEASFANILGSQVITFLNEKGLGIQRIHDIIGKIEPPDVPDADTIFAKGKSGSTGLDEDEFRRILYLLYLCEKLDRRPKYLYFKMRRAD
jgi:hypothetical protein